MTKVWQDLVLSLLTHFDFNEGTTYLYHPSEREEFLETVDPSIREEVKQLLDQYHIDAANL